MIIEAKSIEASLVKWRAKAKNYLEDMDDETLTGESRASVRQALNNSNLVIEQLETEHAQVILLPGDTGGYRTSIC